MTWDDVAESLRRSVNPPAAVVSAWEATRRHELCALLPAVELTKAEPADEEALRAWAVSASRAGEPLPSALITSLFGVVWAGSHVVAKLALGAVARQKPDPRMASLLVQLAQRREDLLARPVARNQLCRALLQHADTGCLELLRRLQPEVSEALWVDCHEVLRQLDARPPPPDGWLDGLAHGRTPGAASPRAVQTEDELWAMVYEQPGNLGLRAVLSDALTERGDPRGPFIARQLAGDGAPPEAEVAARFLAPIADALEPGSVRFRAGFPVEGVIDWKCPARALAAMLLRPEWATFEKLDRLPRLSPTLRSLHTARDLSAKGVREWVKHRWAIPLEHVGVDAIPELALVARLPRPPRSLLLRHLDLAPDFDLGELFTPLVGIPGLASMHFGYASLRQPGGNSWSSETGAHWPRWTERARDVPGLREVSWRVGWDGLAAVKSTVERFDTLRVVVPSNDWRAGDLERFARAAAQVRQPTSRLVVEGAHAERVDVVRRAMAR